MEATCAQTQRIRGTVSVKRREHKLHPFNHIWLGLQSTNSTLEGLPNTVQKLEAPLQTLRFSATLKWSQILVKAELASMKTEKAT